MQPKVSSVCIVDFFAGTGYDKNGVAGSPIRILQEVKIHLGNIFKKNVKIKIFLNEINKKKFDELTTACTKYLEENKDVGRAIEIEYKNENFEKLFNELLPIMKALPCLVYLDQNGIKYIAENYLFELEKLKQTDFLYFVSSSYFRRFGHKPEFKKHIDIDVSILKKDPQRFIHRNLIEQLRAKLPKQTKLNYTPSL